jgi:hypothetical protein
VAAQRGPGFWRGVFEVEVIGAGPQLGEDGLLEALQAFDGPAAFGVREVRTRPISRRRAAEALSVRGDDPHEVVTDWGRRKTDRFPEWTCPVCLQTVSGRAGLHDIYCPGPPVAEDAADGETGA